MQNVYSGSVTMPVELSNITTYVTQRCLVCPIQTELSKDMAISIQENILEKVHSQSYLGVIIDLSGVNIIDSVLWNILSNTSVMINMLGFRTVLTGMNPGIVASIVDIDLDFSMVTTAMTIENALEILTSSVQRY